MKKQYFKIIFKSCRYTLSILLFFIIFTGTTFSYWAGTLNSSPPSTGNSDLNIGNWDDLDDIGPEVSLTNFAISVFNSSALLSAINRPAMSGANSLYILGYADQGPIIRPSGALKVMDVFIYRRFASQGGQIVVLQKFDEFDEDYVFSSWERLSQAVTDSSVGIKPVTSYHGDSHEIIDQWQKEGVYTRGSAPVRHTIKGVTRRFLAWNNRVTSEPGVDTCEDICIGEEGCWKIDWFELSDSWLPQWYAPGTFIEHNGRHWRVSGDLAAAPTDMPGDNNSHIWHEIPLFEYNQVIHHFSDGPPEGSSWSQGDIVEYDGEYFIAMQNHSSLTPPADSSVTFWQQFTQWDAQNTVRTWTAGTISQPGDFFFV